MFDLKGDAGSLLVKYDEGNSVCNIFLTTADEALISWLLIVCPLDNNP